MWQIMTVSFISGQFNWISVIVHYSDWRSGAGLIATLGVQNLCGHVTWRDKYAVGCAPSDWTWPSEQPYLHRPRLQLPPLRLCIHVHHTRTRTRRMCGGEEGREGTVRLTGRIIARWFSSWLRMLKSLHRNNLLFLWRLFNSSVQGKQSHPIVHQCAVNKTKWKEQGTDFCVLWFFTTTTTV